MRANQAASAYRCWAQIDLNALGQNLAWIRRRVGAGTRILTVVKADAYGHGLRQIAAALMHGGTDVFGVANLEEARSIRQVGAGWPILMLGACLPNEVTSAIRDDVMPTISTAAEAQQFSMAALKLGKQIPVHVKVDTGMGRLGARQREATLLIQTVTGLRGLRLEGVYSHYASADKDPEQSAAQQDRFQKVLDQVRKLGIPIPCIHANNSAGLLFEPKTQFNLVRPGLLVYGITPPSTRPLPHTTGTPLHPVLSWNCRIALVKEISRGTPLSYGATFVARRRMRVATLTAGYGDGYPRSGSNQASVLIHGTRCRVLGQITMDQMIADVSKVPTAGVGDPVTLIGREKEECITAAELAAACGSIPWEVLTSITYRVPRLYHGAHAA
ncbi:MAG: alanine racemase [Verrucomicrobia bacterium]|nr:alanine racemase [Verrucomicrobiota bacterium]